MQGRAFVYRPLVAEHEVKGDLLDDLVKRLFGTPSNMVSGLLSHQRVTLSELGHIRQLEKALVQVQRNAFEAAGVTGVTLDFDSTYVFSRSKRRQGADRTYKKGYALHPLLCFDAASGAAHEIRSQDKRRDGRSATALELIFQAG